MFRAIILHTPERRKKTNRGMLANDVEIAEGTQVDISFDIGGAYKADWPGRNSEFQDSIKVGEVGF